MGIVTVLLTLLLLSCIYDADSKTKPDDDDPTQNVGQLIETIKTILEIKNDIQRAYENVAKNKKSTGKDDEDCIEIEPGTNPNNSKPITSNNANHSLPFKYSETVDKSPIGNADQTKSAGIEVYDILSKKHNKNDRNSLRIKQAGMKITVNKNIKKSGKTTEDATRKILFFQRNKSVKINLPKKVQPTSSKPAKKDSKQPKDSLTPTETDESQPPSAKVYSEIIHDVKNEAVLLKSESLSETPTARIIMPINSQPTINILKTDTVLPKTTKSVSETVKSERKTSKSPTNSMDQSNVTRNTVSVKPKTTVPKKSSKGSVTSLDDLNSSNSDIILPKTSGLVNKINVISKSTLSSTKQNGIMNGGQKKNIISSGSSATSQSKTSHGRKPELHSHTEPSITVSKPTIANEVFNIIPSHDYENPQSISRNSKLITGIKVGGNKRLLRKNDFSYTNKLTSQQKGSSVINEPVTISKSMSNPSDENQSSSNKGLSMKGVSGTTTPSSPLSKDFPVSNDRIHTTQINDEQTQTETNDGNHISSVTQTDSPIKNSNMTRTLDSTIVSVKKIKENLKTTDGKHDDKIFGKGHVTDEDKSNTKPKSPLVNKDPMLNENVGEDTKILVVGQLSPSIITGNGRLASKAVESGQLSMPHGLSNSNAFVVNSGPRFVNNHVSMEKINRKQTIDGLNKGQKIVNKLSNSDMPSNDDQSSINIITTDYISKTGNLQVSKETTVQPEHNTVPGSIVTGSLGIEQVVARNTLSARPTFVSVVPTPPKSHLSNFIERNFDDQAVNGKRVQSINTLNVSPNEKTNFDDQAVNGNRVQNINTLNVSPNNKITFDDQAVNGNRVQNVNLLNVSPNEKTNFDDQAVNGNRVQNINALDVSPNEKTHFDDQTVNGNRVQTINALDVSPNEKTHFDDQAVNGNRVQSINTVNVSPNEKTNFDDQAVNENRVQNINALDVSPNEKTNFDDQAVYGNRVQNINALDVSPNEKTNFDDQAVYGNRVQNINALDVSPNEKTNFDDQAVYGNRVQNINALNVSPNENTNIGNSITLNLKVHSDGENSIHNTFDNNVNSDLFKSGVSVKSLSTDSPVSSNTDESLFVVTASLQSTQTKVQKAKSNEEKNKSLGTIVVPNKQMAGFVPMKTIVDPLKQFSKNKTEFSDDQQMKDNISAGKTPSKVPTGLTIQILPSNNDKNAHVGSKKVMSRFSRKLKKTGKIAVITKPGTSNSQTLSTATEKQHHKNMDSLNSDLFETKHTRIINVDGSEPTSTNKQPSKRLLMFPGMVQSITNFENNRVLYNAFRKFKLAGLKRQRRSTSIPSFLQKRLDKPIKVYNNAYESGKRSQNSIQIKGTNKVRKMFFEVPNNTEGSIETPTESYKDSKILKTKPEMEVSLNSPLENMKNSVHQSEKYSGSSGVVIHRYTTEKPRLQKRRKSRHTKRHIKDGLFRRISRSLSNGLPIYSKTKKESTLEKKRTKPGKSLSNGNGMRINLGNIEQTQQAKSRSKDVIKVNRILSQSRVFMSGDHFPVSKTAIKPMNVFYDTKFELPKTSNSADSIPKQNDQWYEMPQSNIKSILKTDQHDINNDNNDNNHNSFPVDTAIPLNRRKMPTYKSPFIPSNQMIDNPTKTDEVKPTKILSYHSSDSSSNGLSSKPDKSFVFNPQPHHDSITDRTKFVSGLSEFNDMAVENDFPNFNNQKPSESNLNGHNDYILNLNDIGTGQIDKSPLDNIRPNVINLSNIKIVPGGCIIEGRFYRYEELPKFIQDFYDNKTKNEHLKLSLGDVENVLNDYTENTGSISQSFSTDFPMLELIKGNDSSPFSIQLPGDSQGYDILVDPNLHEGSLELAVLHANNFAAGNDRFGSPRTMVSRPDINNRQTKMKGKENNRQLLSPVLKWSEGVNDKAGTDLAPIPNYQVASDIRVVNSLSADRFRAQNDDPNDFSVSQLNGNRFGSYNNGMKEVISLPGMRIKDQKVLTKFFNPIHISSKKTIPLVQRKTIHQYKKIDGAPSDIILRGFLDIPQNSMAAKLPLSKPFKKTENQNTKTGGVARKLGLVRKQAKPDAQSNDEAEELVFKNPRQNMANHNAQSNNVANKLGFRSLVLENAFKDPPLNAVAGKLSLNSQVQDKPIQNVQSSGKAIKNTPPFGGANKLGLKSKVQDKASQDSQSNTIKEKVQDKKQSDDKADKLKSNKVILQGKTQSDDKADNLKSNKVIQANDHRETSRVDLVSGSSINTKPRDTYPHNMRKNNIDDKLNKHKGKHGTSHNDMWLNGLDGKLIERLNTGIQDKIPNDIKSNSVATNKRLNSRKQGKTIRHEKDKIPNDIKSNSVATNKRLNSRKQGKTIRHEKDKIPNDIKSNSVATNKRLNSRQQDKTIRHEKQLNRVVTKNTKRPKKTVLRDGALKPNDKVFSIFKDNKHKSKQLKNNPFANLKNILKATSSAKKSIASNVRSVQKGPRTFFDIIENNIISPFKSVPVDTQLKDNFASNFNLGEILKNGVSAFHHEPVTFPNFIAPPKRNLIMSPTASVPLHLAGQHNLESIMSKIVTTPFGMRQNTIMNIFG